MLFLLRTQGKWRAFRSAKSARGCEADMLIWLERPTGTDEELSVLPNVGNDPTKIGVLDDILAAGYFGSPEDPIVCTRCGAPYLPEGSCSMRYDRKAPCQGGVGEHPRQREWHLTYGALEILDGVLEG